ncbi:MAG: type II toxin-antitoxin system HicB family antitoxin [Candidatus Bipolaricaulota bacterium]|nr:type II toxin-antitoxin system HicB family antitoxin [Candidatus Bipolaricaulota bacterium]
MSVDLRYRVVIHPAAEGGFWAEVPALPGCFAQGETYEEVLQNVLDAMELVLEHLQETGQPLPDPDYAPARA